jgi:hypothetical protein
MLKKLAHWVGTVGVVASVAAGATDVLGVKAAGIAAAISYLVKQILSNPHAEGGE